jgi:dihydropteroate synthase
MSSSRWLRASGQSAKVMGVLNCTPDSFSDGGRFTSDRSISDRFISNSNQFISDSMDVDAAVRHAVQMHASGAAIIDVGGESTRPGAKPVPLDDELARVIPVIRSLHQLGIATSIDTNKAEVMRQAIEAGADMVNDVTALTGDEQSLSVVAQSGIDVCLMHMQGAPETMQHSPEYQNTLQEVGDYLESRVDACLKAGIAESSILIDPGIGFGKRLDDNLDLIAGIELLKRRLGLPLLMGVSRKSFLGAITGADVEAREMETAAAVSISVYAGADVLRVHDVEAQGKVVKVASRLRDAALRLS